MSDKYVHGYDTQEARRLENQASTLTDLLHGDTIYPAGSAVLEAGAGVGAQTIILATNSPKAKITSIDISERSLAKAKHNIDAIGITNVHFQQANIFDLPFEQASFDHVFVCFVLEHLAKPLEALQSLKTVLKPGGTITVIEGDHGSAYFYPESEAAHRVIRCQVEVQRRSGGDPCIGRQLYPLLSAAGYASINVSPRLVYVDATHPDLVEGFIKETFTEMIKGIRKAALEYNLIDAGTFDEGIAALNRTAEPDGVFSYTFFKATAIQE